MNTPNASAYLIGLDIGTSGAKAVVIDRQGRLLAWSGREYPIHIPRPGWAEQDPEDWLAAALACVREVVDKIGMDPGQAAGMALAGQMHSLVCLGKDHAPLRPAIIWADQRSAAQVRRIAAQIGRDNLAAWTGNPLAAGFMLASWAWLEDEEPQTVKAVRWLLLPKDYVRFRLTGQVGAEPSDASSTLLFDPHRVRWSSEILAEVGLNEEHLPPLHRSQEEAGGLLPEMAAACGLRAGIPVIYGGSDVSLQALAQGITGPGTVSCTIGTGGQLFAPLRRPLHDPELRLHLFCHVLPDTWHQEAAILSAGLSLRWLRENLWPESNYASLADAAGGASAALDGLFFLPFLAGERTPYMEPGLRAGFIGLGLRHGQAHMVRAVMEGVVFALRNALEVMESVGVPAERLVATGGATRHPLWVQLQANIFGRAIEVSQVDEATARGAALLAGMGLGMISPSFPARQQSEVHEVKTILPEPHLVEAYQAAFQDYRKWAGAVVDRYRAEW